MVKRRRLPPRKEGTTSNTNPSEEKAPLPEIKQTELPGMSEKPTTPAIQANDGREQGQRMLEGAKSAQADLRAVAALMDVDYRKLMLCIVREIGWLGMIRCLRSLRDGGSFLECVTQNVDMEAIWGCVEGSVSNHSEGEF